MTSATRLHLQHSLSFAVRYLRALGRYGVILCLGLLLSIALFNLAQGLFRAGHYFWFSKKPQAYPVDLDTLYWGFKFLALYLVSMFLLSRYRSRQIQYIMKRSAIFGLVLGIFLIGALALDQLVVQYYSNQIDCELPDPMARNRQYENSTNSR